MTLNEVCKAYGLSESGARRRLKGIKRKEIVKVYPKTKKTLKQTRHVFEYDEKDVKRAIKAYDNK